MPTREQIVTFLDDTPPDPATSPWVAGRGPERGVEIAEPDDVWATWYLDVVAHVRGALGLRVLGLQHVGSTSVRGLPAKPVVDVDLTVADPDDEDAYVPALERAGFVLHVREPWWYGHRLLRHPAPRANLHVFGPDSPEVWRHRLFRDWLRGNPDDRALYARVKREAAAATNDADEDGTAYNRRKHAVVREIYARAFAAAGLTG
ncbi:GrpB family protein [Xylanimonas protaetiae]|uniref:GrpB family protein n=1 Tax=Xylanimonas protaetiae TaxID=2509457 RepID=A0A4P6F266_9MICO|nr:GrpB family protein [Xylanimonas protaetiae]QAY69594.1 GrpB family protein [Xylanimonas protaetiae]